MVPWPLSFLAGGDRSGALGIVYDPARSAGPLLRSVTGTNGGGVGGWGLLIGGVVVVLLASGERARWCLRLWAIALLSFALALLPTWIGTASPAPEAVLVPAGLALSLLVAIGAATFTEEVRRARWAGATSRSSVWRSCSYWPDSGSWATRCRAAGINRRRIGTRPSAGCGRSVTKVDSECSGSGIPRSCRARSIGPAPMHSRSPSMARRPCSTRSRRRAAPAVMPCGTRSAESGRSRCIACGRLVQPMGVRYIVVVRRIGPGSGSTADPALERGLQQQLDLRELDGSRARPCTRTSSGVRRVRGRRWSRPGPGSVAGKWGPRRPHHAVWSQQYDDGWEARSGSQVLTHRRVAGWANGFVPVGTNAAEVRDTNQWYRWVALAIELLIIAACARSVLRRDRRARRARRAARTVESGLVESAPVES